MSFAATVRRKLAIAALAAIVVPTFLPALHALPGLGHRDCACGIHNAHEQSIHAGDATCGHDHEDHARCDHAASTCRALAKNGESEVGSSGWTVDRTDGHRCLLCDLFAAFLLTKPESGFALPEIDAVAALLAPASPCVKVYARTAACRGPPVAV